MSTQAIEPTAGRPDVMTVDEAARWLRVNRKTIYEAAARGDFPAQRLGRRFIISRDAVTAWLLRGKR